MPAASLDEAESESLELLAHDAAAAGGVRGPAIPGITGEGSCGRGDNADTSEDGVSRAETCSCGEVQEGCWRDESEGSGAVFDANCCARSQRVSSVPPNIVAIARGCQLVGCLSVKRG